MDDRIGGWILTYTGKKFYPLDPRPEDISIIDVAHSLSMKCRWNGHTYKFYSVAEHSWYVSLECYYRTSCVDTAMWGLLHDAGEAYGPDIPRPIKRMGTGVLFACEKSVMNVIRKKYSLLEEMPDIVREVDNALMVDEAEQLMSGPIPIGGVKTGDTIRCFAPDEIKLLFLNHWNMLCDHRKELSR
jgi:hypothetical protein